MEIRYLYENASNDVLISFIERLRHLPYHESRENYVNKLLDFWDEFILLQSGDYKYFTGLNQEIYPLEHFIGEDKIVMHFNIKHIQQLIGVGKLFTTVYDIKEIIEDLAYVNMGSKNLLHSAYSTPLIAVIMPTITHGNPKKYALIDGNHRLSAAIHLNKRINVCCINNTVIPPYAFTSHTNWILYNLILGFYIITSWLPEAEDYLENLDRVIIKN